MMENSVSSDGGLEKMKCHGLTQPSAHHEGAAALRPVEPYVSLVKTQPGLRPSYKLQTTFQKGSPPPSGTGCSVENLSTSTRSSPQCTLSSLMRKERDAWDQLKLFLPLQRPSSRSKPDWSGLQPSGERPRQPHSFSPIKGRNCSNMRNISRASLLPSMSEPTRRSSYMTNQSETKSEGAKISYSPTINASTASARQYSMQMGLNMASPGERKEEDQGKLEKGRKISVRGSTVQRAASSQRESVITDMSAKDAEREVTGSQIAEQSHSKDEARGMVPKYLHYNLWDPALDFTPNTADWTELAKPLVGPPELELKDEAVTKLSGRTRICLKLSLPCEWKCLSLTSQHIRTGPLYNQCAMDSGKVSGPGP